NSLQLQNLRRSCASFAAPNVPKDMKTICSMSAQRSFIRHWKLISRSVAVVDILFASALVQLGATSSSVKNAQRSKTVKVWSPQREKPGLNAKVPRNVRLRRVCSERCAWDRDGQANLESAAGRS